jgi:hypothetical protein
MADWKYTLKAKNLFDLIHEDDSVENLRKFVSGMITKLESLAEVIAAGEFSDRESGLTEVIWEFRSIESEKDGYTINDKKELEDTVNEASRALYNWADKDHICWVDSLFG